MGGGGEPQSDGMGHRAAPVGDLPDKELLVVRFFRSPWVVGIALLGSIATAFQVAGVTSMILASIILAAGVWVFITIEVLCSKWIKKFGRYFGSIVLLASCLSGVLSVRLAVIISELRHQQATLSVQPQMPTPHTESQERAKQEALEKEILQKLDEIQKGAGSKSGAPFAMFVASSLIALGKDASSSLYIVCNTMYGRTVSPVKMAVYVGLMNRQPFATIIKSYKAEARDPKGKWVTFTTIDTISSEVWMGYPIGASVNKSKFFDRLVADGHIVKQDESVIGWMLFDYPAGWDAPGDVRITVTDISGVSSSVKVLNNSPMNEGGQGSDFWDDGARLDLLRLRFKPYSERWKN